MLVVAFVLSVGFLRCGDAYAPNAQTGGTLLDIYSSGATVCICIIDIYSDVLGSCRHFDETKNETKIFMERLGRASVLLSIYFEWLTTSGAILF